MTKRQTRDIKYFNFKLITGISLTLFTLSAQASGFRVPEVSAAGTATSNALVANTEELGALPYNPAGMANHDGANLVAGLTYLKYDLSVTPTGGSKTDNVGEDTFIIPNLYYMDHIGANWTWGLAINAPFGLETKWPDNTFPAFGGYDAAEPALSKIEMLNYNPNIAYQVDENFSIAFGLDYYDVRKVNLNSQSTVVTGKGHHHGWNLAFLQKADNLSFGFSYHSPVHVNIEGSLGTVPVTTDITFPATIQFGVRYAATDKLDIEFDWDRTNWRSFDAIVIRSKASGAALTTSTNNWENATAYRLGAIYDLSSKTQLRFGYSLDETPQTANALFSARIADADRQLFSLGVAQDFSGWELEASYMYVRFDDRTVNSTTTYSLGDEANGSTAYNGNYEAEVNLFSLGITTTF